MLFDRDKTFDFYKSKKILLTGNTGFKGVWLSLLLEQMGASVWGYSLPLGNDRVPDRFFQEVTPRLCGSTYGDISDTDLVTECILKFKPDIIFHLASHSSLNHSMEIPHYILRTNMMGTLNVLEAARQLSSICAVLVVTSDKVYQNLSLDIGYTEDCPLGGDDPYSVSKVCQELLTRCYSRTFFGNEIRTATARASNTIGPGDYNQTRLFPYLVEEFWQNRVPAIRNPKAVRPWQSVLDVVTGYLMLGRYLYEKSDLQWKDEDITFNFGPSKEGFLTVEEIAAMVGREFGDGRFEVRHEGDHIKQETQILKLDSAKAAGELGWIPREPVSVCIHRSVQFFKKEKGGENIRDLARAFVMDYMREWGSR